MKKIKIENNYVRNMKWFNEGYRFAQKEEIKFLKDVISEIKEFLFTDNSDFGELEILLDSIEERIKQLKGEEKGK